MGTSGGGGVSVTARAPGGVSVTDGSSAPSSVPGGDPRLPLHIVTGAEASQRESPYNPQTEAISPTLPADGLDESPLRSTKDELLGQISTIDREIMKAESQIAKLKRKQSELEQHAARPDGSVSEDEREPKMTSLPQTIYADNRKRARTATADLEKLKPAQVMPAVGADGAERWRLHAVQPLYNQPSDVAAYAANRAAFATFKPRLVASIRRRRLAEIGRDRDTLHTYTGQLRQWLRRIQQHEMVPKHRQCAARDREFYEKVFPEIRRLREERERLAAGGGRPARPDGAEQDDQPDGVQQKMTERQRLLSLAVVPPPMLDARRRKHRFINRGGLTSEALQLHDDLSNLNVWTEEERQTFNERFLQHPKQFHVISAALERHSTRECVRHYYLSKKQFKYKERLKKARSRGRTRGPARPPPAPLVIGADLPGMTTRGALQQRGRTGGSAAAGTATSTSSAVPAPAPAAPAAAAAATAAPADGGSQPEGGDTGTDTKPAAVGSGEEPTVKVEERGDAAEPAPPAVACAVCQTEQGADTADEWRPLLPEHATLYGLSEDTLPADARVCAVCRGRSARRRYPQVKCPIPTCPTPRQRVKRLRPLPARWADADASLRQTIAAELQLTPEVIKCCTACRGRLARRLAGRPEPPAEPPWTDDELERLRQALRSGGADWTAAAAAVGSRRPAQCRRLYAQRRPELGLQRALAEYRQAAGLHLAAEDLTDTDTESEESSGAEEDERPVPTASERRGDSSATVSADEASAEPEVKVVAVDRPRSAALQNHADPPPAPARSAAPAEPPPGPAVCAISPPPTTSLGPRPSIGDLIDVTINRSFRNVLARMEREGDSPTAGGDARDFTLNSLLTAGERRGQPPPQPQPQPVQDCDNVAQDLSGTPMAAMDGLMRPPATHLREGGSITQGTPMQPEPRRRDNPTTGGGLVGSAEPGAYTSRAGPGAPAGYPYPGGPPPGDHLSSRHVLITDYITSQQMHGRRDSRSSSDGGGDPRASPRDLAIRPGPGPGPSRPPADSYQRLAAAPYAPDNFSTLVDVAVAQSNLMAQQQAQQQAQHQRQQQAQQAQQRQNSINKEMAARAAGRGLDKAGLTAMGLIDTIINRSMTQESCGAGGPPPPEPRGYPPVGRGGGPAAGRDSPRSLPPPERPTYPAAPPPPPDSYGYRYRGAPAPASRSAVGASPLDYVKNKIAEVMRTSDKSGEDGEEPAKRARLEPTALCLTRGSNGGVATPPPPAAHRPRPPSERATPADGSAM
ncbi:uncharacterized protein LOC122369609 [Amphibalanus amphitrite]|uniref:uncharacterized protein LOC122369609 n=1 Tax=Amphibalanus amphitrite TaxID=1232801 RepID=UPI001C928574|nr:uncharacterized protein LOC122369609 [Amphibalanus amphitrite]